LIVGGLVGEPTAPVTEIAAATNTRRLSLRRAECVRSLEFWFAQLVAAADARGSFWHLADITTVLNNVR
jgi:hypothetical protein